MSLVLVFGFLLMAGSGIYLYSIHRNEYSASSPKSALKPATPFLPGGPQPVKEIQPKKIGIGGRIGIVFAANIGFYLIQFILPLYSLGFFFVQIGLNLLAAIYCFSSGRSDLGRTFLLCLLWVLLIGPAILASLCFVIVGVSSFIH